MRIFILVSTLIMCMAASAEEATPFPHPLYLGGIAGYGATTWEGLVPSPLNQNMAMNTSTPVMVREGGAVWGFFAGYELSPYFALEANYMRYPNAMISFDEESIFAFDNDGLIELNTSTATLSVMGKIMLIIPDTKVRAYSSFGAAEIHRWDDMTENKRLSPTFGLGLNYTIYDHVMMELGANYTAGYGESELNPAKDYVPFLYSGFLKLGYRI